MKKLIFLPLILATLTACNALSTPAVTSDMASAVTSDETRIATSETVSDMTSEVASESTSREIYVDTSETTTSALNSDNVVSTNEAVKDSSRTDNITAAFNKIISVSRQRGTAGESEIASYLTSQLEIAGYDADIVPFPVYKNSISSNSKDFFNLNPFEEEPLLTAHNIIAEKNFDPNKKTIIFSAHYDTTESSIGATDNASGTAVLLEAAKLILPYIGELDYNVRIIFFSSEEYYLTGSRTYISGLNNAEFNNISACFNIDMTSTKKWRKPTIDGEESNFSREFMRLNPNFVKIEFGASDNTSFSKKSIMSFRFTTVNSTDKSFDSTVLGQETDNKYVDIKLIKEDADIVFNFMKNLEIANL